MINCDASDIVAETKDDVQDKANRLTLIFKGCTTEHKIIHAINILSPKNGYYKLSLNKDSWPNDCVAVFKCNEIVSSTLT